MTSAGNSAMAVSRIEVQPLGLGLFAGDNHVHEVAAAQALIGNAQQSVAVGRKIDTNDVGLFVYHVVYESGILMAETVMVLTPDMRG